MAVTSAGTPAPARSATSGYNAGTWGSGQARTAGNLLVATVTMGSDTVVSAVPTESTSTWTRSFYALDGTGHVLSAVFIKTAAGGDAAPSIYTAWSGNGSSVITLLELSGSTNTIDCYGTWLSASAGTLTPTATASSATTAAGDYVVSGTAIMRTAATDTWTPGTGFTNLYSDGSISSATHSSLDYMTSNPASGVTPSDAGNWAAETSADGCGFIACFKSGMAEITGPAYNANDTWTVTTTGYTPVANTLQVAVVALGNGGGGTVSAMSVTGSSTGAWTLIGSNGGIGSAKGVVAVFAHDAGASPVSETVALSFSPFGPCLNVGMIIRQFNHAAPAALQSGVSASSTADVFQLAITPGTTGSQVVGGLALSGAQTALTANASTTFYGTTTGPSDNSTIALFEATSLSTAGTPVTAGSGHAVPSQSDTIFLLEILPAAGMVTAALAGAGSLTAAWTPKAGASLGGGGTVTAAATATSPGAEHIIVPAYSYPASGASSPYWEALYAAAPSLKILIADVNSGNLGGSADTDYVAAIAAALATPGIIVVGYVDTEHASTPIGTIETNIGLWNTYYGVTSIFFDNASTDAPGSDFNYYQTLCNLVHETPGAITVLNHGVTPNQEYASIGDVMVVFEGPSYPDGTGIGDWQSALAGTIPDIPKLPASWFSSYLPGRFAALVYETTPSAGLSGGTPLAWQTVLTEAQAAGIGLVYLTDATYAGNPYDVLPSYWSSEVAAVAATGGGGATYYVSAAGSDSNSGLSAGAPWATVAKVNAATLTPGTTILFRGGDTFSGTALAPAQSGTLANPITFGSYGTGQATITNGSASGWGILIYNVGGFVIENLTITGTGAINSSAYSGIWIVSQGAGQLPGFTITNCTISGWQYGVAWGASNATDGFSNITLTNVNASGNSYAGIWSWTSWTFNPSAPAYSFSSVAITNCTASSNLGNPTTGNQTGTGILVASCNGGTVTGCTAAGNGTLNACTTSGPTGIWTFVSNNVVISDCVAYGNSSNTSVDGEGFDIDLGCTNCVIEYCLAYSNGGGGIMCFGDPAAPGHAGNTIRYNLTWGNSQRNGLNNYGEICVDGTITNDSVYGNTCVAVDNGSLHNVPFVAVGGGTYTGVTVRNNIFYATGQGQVAYTYQPATLTTAGILLQGNLYWSAGTFALFWNGTTYASLAAFQAGQSGQEKVSGSPVGLQANPLLTAAATAPAVTSPSNLGGAGGLKPTAASPVIGAGLNLQSLFSVSPGTQDVFGNTLSVPLWIGASAVTGTGGVLAGAGTVHASAGPAVTAALAGAGTVTAADVKLAPAALAGAGTVTAAAVTVPGGAASLAGAGKITAAATVLGAVSALAGTGSLTAAGSESLFAAAALAAGTGTASTAVVQGASAALAGAGTVIAPVVQGSGTALAGVGSIAAAAGARISGAAVIAGTGAVTAAVVQESAAAPAGAGGLTAAAGISFFSGATLGGTGTASGSAVQRSGAAEAGTGTVTAAEATLGGASLGGAGSTTAAVTQTGGTALAGAGALASPGTVTGSAATLAGAGSLTAASSSLSAGGSSPAGAGSLTAAASVTQGGAGSLAGAGSLTAAASMSLFAGGAALAAAGTVTAAATQDAAAACAGAGSLTAVPSERISGAATLAGAGSLGPVTIAQQSAASMAGAGSLTAAAAQLAASTVAGAGSITAGGVHVGSATLPGAGTATTTAATQAPSVLAGAGSVTTAAVQGAPAALAGGGSLTAAGVIPGAGAAALPGAGTLTGSAVQAAGAVLGGAGGLGAQVMPGAGATLTGAGTASAAGAASSASALTGAGSLTAAAGMSLFAGSSALPGSGSLATSAVQGAAAVLAAAGIVTAAGAQSGGVSLPGTGSLTAAALQQASAALAGAGTVTAAGLIPAILAGAGTITAGGVTAPYIAAILAGAGSLGAYATGQGAAACAGAGGLTASPSGSGVTITGIVLRMTVKVAAAIPLTVTIT